MCNRYFLELSSYPPRDLLLSKVPTSRDQYEFRTHFGYKRSLIYFVAILIPKVYFSLYKHKVKFLNCTRDCLICNGI